MQRMEVEPAAPLLPLNPAALKRGRSASAEESAPKRFKEQTYAQIVDAVALNFVQVFLTCDQPRRDWRLDFAGLAPAAGAPREPRPMQLVFSIVKAPAGGRYVLSGKVLDLGSGRAFPLSGPRGFECAGLSLAAALAGLSVPVARFRPRRRFTASPSSA